MYEKLDPEKLRHVSRLDHNPLINVPIAQRLVLGFLVPAIIAALIAGTIGLQSAQLLSQKSNFYPNLFQSYSSLTTGNDFLQLMNFKISAAISDASISHPAQDQLASDRAAVQGLETRYDTLLSDYIQHDLLSQHPDQAEK